MQKASTQPGESRISTESFAAQNGVKAQSIRARLCETGSYYGIKPAKLANRRLAWPDVIVIAAGDGQ